MTRSALARRHLVACAPAGALLAFMASLAGLAGCGGTDSSPADSSTAGADSSGGTDSSGGASTETIPGGTDTEAAASENVATHDQAEDCVWDPSSAVSLVLNGSSVTVDSANVVVSDSDATITAAGTYLISGQLTDGRIIVDSADDGLVQLVLSGASLTSGVSAPLHIESSAKTVLIVESENTVSDAANYTVLDEEGEPNAAVFSKDDLTICGTGTLTVNGNYADGIASKDGLVIKEATLDVTAVDDAIRGKDYLMLDEAQVTADSGGDGLVATNDTDAAAGYIFITNSEISVISGGDGLAATTDVMVSSGNLVLRSGGGSGSVLAADASAKGIKGLESVVIDDGTFSIDAADDAIHSNSSIVVHGGTLGIASGDDGLHADALLNIDGGTIDVQESYEGLESALITIAGGTTHLITSDDGVNVAGGDGSGSVVPPGGGSPDSFASTGDYALQISGGYLTMDSEGDGLDSNGSLTMSGGTVIVNGPTGSANAAIDAGSFSITGGLLVSVHTEQMSDEINGSIVQNLVKVGLGTTMSAGTLLHIESSTGDHLLTFAPKKSARALVFSSPELVNGSYSVYAGGSSTGTPTDGLYLDGTYTPGTLLSDFEVSSTLTTVGTSGGGGGQPPGMP